MTNKQIIIDGEQCEYLSDTGLCRLTYLMTEKSYDCSMCKDNPNCSNKQLKAKEQECDQLKQAIARVKELIQKEINDCFNCGDCISCGYNCCLRQAMQICNEVISE